MERKISLSKKILAVNLISIIICTISIAYFSYAYISSYLKDDSYTNNVQTLEQAANVMEEILSSLVKQTHFIIENELFQITLDEVLSAEHYNYAKAESIFTSIFESIRMKDKYYKYIYLYTDSGNFWDGQGYNVHIQDFKQTEVYNKLIETGLIAWTDGKYVLNDKDTEGISFLLSVPTRANYTKEAYLYVKLNQYMFEKYLKSLINDMESTYFIIDQEFNIVASDYTTGYESVIDDATFREMVKKEDKGYFHMMERNQKSVITYAYIPYTKWRIINIQPVSNIMTQVDYFKNIFIIIVLISAIISVLFNSYISHLVINPLLKLTKKIKKIQMNNLNVRVKSHSRDEIGDLSRHFNYMMDRVQGLIGQIEKEQHDLKKMEIDLLQSQINPHFLYNTLDTIYWKVQLGEDKIAGDMILWLSRMLRIGLSKGEDKVTIREELHHIDNYLKLQQVAYNNKFTYTIHCPEELHEYKTVKIIIQPIVENSVNHGFNNMKKDGHIDISIKDTEEGNLCMTIMDNGTGINEDRIKTGYALQNIMKRLTLYYGKNYGIQIMDDGDYIGTIVQIKIPKEK